jgi:hypothetical protein
MALPGYLVSHQHQLSRIQVQYMHTRVTGVVWRLQGITTLPWPKDVNGGLAQTSVRPAEVVGGNHSPLAEAERFTAPFACPEYG